MSLSRQMRVVHAIARVSTAFVWLYHGIVPKLLFVQPDELFMLEAGGVSAKTAHHLLPVVGIAETGIGLLVLATWHYRWPLYFSAAAMVVALLGVAITSPAYLIGAFNPVTLNIATFALSVIGAISLSSEKKLPLN